MIAVGNVVVPLSAVATTGTRTPRAVAETATTTGGLTRHWVRGVSGGVPVTVSGGWWTDRQVEALERLATDVSAVFPLFIDGEETTVRFRFEDAAYAFEQIADDTHIGAVNLITI